MSNLVKVEHRTPGADQHVYIATPAHTIFANFHVSLLRNVLSLVDAGVSVTYAHLAGHCHVDDARNLLVADFLKTACTDLIFFDADVAAESGAALKLLSYDVGMVGGAYPLKDGSKKFPVRFGATNVPPMGTKLSQCEAIATGFLRIRRDVFQALRDGCGELWLDGTKAHQFFNRWQEPADFAGDGSFMRIGGDMNFCRKWTAKGGFIYVDPSLLFTHAGVVDFAGRLSDHLEKT